MTAAPAAGHVLRVSVQGDHVVLRVDCHQPADADCRTVGGGCILADDHCNDGDMLAEYHTGPDEPLSDGMPIVVSWSSQEEWYEWHGRLEDGPLITEDEARAADVVIPDGVLSIASRAAGPIYAEFHAGANLVGTAEERGGAIFLAGLVQVLAAGWVLVPGPVHTQWGQDIHGEVWPRKDEADALAFAAADASDVRSRLVTEWRPAGDQP